MAYTKEEILCLISEADKRTVVEAAKALLMEQSGMTEKQAHRYIQKQSMDTGTKLIQTARLILGNHC